MALQGMLDSWSTEGFVVPSRVRESFTLTPGTAQYTMGVGGTFDTARPVAIDRVTVELQTTTPKTENPVEIINLDQWADVSQKSTQGIPIKVYREGTNPLETLNLYPVPNQAYKLVIYSQKLLLSITNANTTIDLPPGYERAIIYNLAVELAPEYGRQTPNEVAAIALEAKGNVMRVNGANSLLEVDHAFIGGKRFNIITGP